MKIAPEDITPDLLCAALREMAVEDSNPDSRSMMTAIVNHMLNHPDIRRYTDDLMLDIATSVPSCFPEGMCFHQTRTIFAVAFVAAVSMCNTREDNIDLNKSL